MQFVFDSAQSDPIPEDAQRHVVKRKRYTINACEDCRKRKVKCTGDNPCHYCRARKVDCIYVSIVRPDQGGVDDGDNGVVQISDKRHSRANITPVSPEACCSTESTTSKIELLESRIRALERGLSHVLQTGQVADSLAESPPAILQASVVPATADEDTEGNMFAVRATGPDDVSLSSQVAAMDAYLSRPASPRPRNRRLSKSQMLVELPDPPTLHHLMDVYFRDFDCYFPFLERQDTETRIYGLIRRLGYSSYNRMLLVGHQDLSLIAMTCLMLAMAECLDSENGACDPDSMRPGWGMYRLGFRAIQRLFFTKDIDLDVARTQCLIAAYLMHSEILRAASQAISVALQLAIDIKLNDQRTWSMTSPDEVLSKHLLWWTIFFLDRRIAQKASLPYHIRDTEFCVDDFKSTVQNGQADIAADGQRTLDKQDQPSSLVTVREYVQVLIDLARLWSQVWDRFFAIGAARKTDWMEVEIMDTQILNVRRQLPQNMIWEPHKITEYAVNAEPEPHLRRRLHIYTRLNLLRMLIRQNPLHQTAFNPETAYLCARLSCEIIHAHDAYLARYPGARASGYFVTASMVECVYHLAPVLYHSKDAAERNTSVVALKEANGILIQLSPKLNVAKKALRALKGVMLRWASGNAASNSAQDDSRIIVSTTRNGEKSSSAQRSNTIGMLTDEEWIDMPTAMLFGGEFDFTTTPMASTYDSSIFSLDC